MKKKLSLVSIVVAVMLLALTASPALGGNGNGVENAKRAQEKVNQKVLSNKDVVGTAVGLDSEGSAIVRVFTAKSGVGGIPKEQDGVKVVAQVTGPINALGFASAPVLIPSAQSTTARWDRPVPTGISTGHPAITAGTIGARVIDVDGKIYALSNNHVYADENQASINDSVLQPGAYDGGTYPDDAIGTLFDFEPIVFSTSANNELDAAIALSSLGDLGNATPSDGYGTPKSETVVASLNQKVQKYGRTTSLTKGTITGINATLNIGYGTGTARFVDQIIVETRRPGFIQGGDSGSLLVIQGGADDRKPVGLLYAGTSTGKMAIANHIGAVLTRFSVTIDGEGAAPAPTTGSIAGKVTDSTDTSVIAGASVTTDTGQSTTTNTDGNYTLSDVPTGDRSVTASAIGYEPQTKTATVIENQTTSAIDFSLVEATPPPSTGDMGVYDISWNSKKKNLQFTINIRQDSDGDGALTGDDSPVGTAHVNATLTYDSSGNGVIDDCSVDTCWANFGGNTGTNGSVKFSLVGGAPMGLYQVEVTGLTHTSQVWNTTLDEDNPDTLIR